jgi:hypothetical protein
MTPNNGIEQTPPRGAQLMPIALGIFKRSCMGLVALQSESGQRMPGLRLSASLRTVTNHRPCSSCSAGSVITLLGDYHFTVAGHGARRSSPPAHNA